MITWGALFLWLAACPPPRARALKAGSVLVVKCCVLQKFMVRQLLVYVAGRFCYND